MLLLPSAVSSSHLHVSAVCDCVCKSTSVDFFNYDCRLQGEWLTRTRCMKYCITPDGCRPAQTAHHESFHCTFHQHFTHLCFCVSAAVAPTLILLLPHHSLLNFNGFVCFKLWKNLLPPYLLPR